MKLYLNVQKQLPEVFCKKGVLKNFAKFTGKHLCQLLFLNKKYLLKKENLTHVNFAKFARTFFFIEHLWWLLLILYIGNISNMKTYE